MKSAVLLLVLVALVNSDEGINFLVGNDEGEGNFLMSGDEGEGNFPVGGDKSEGNFLPAEDEGESSFIVDSFDGFNVTMTRDMLYDPIPEEEIELPARLARVSLNVGSICSGCRLLFSSERRVGGVSGKVRVYEIRFARAGITIRSVRVNPIGTRAASIRLQGGVGRNSAIITIRSRPSTGFAYRIQIYGR